MSDARLKIGWAQADITPDEPVLLSGQFHARVSEGVRDPVTATALVLEQGGEHAVFVTCDLSGAYGELQEAVAGRVEQMADGPQTARLAMSATHTHAAPLTFSRLFRSGYGPPYTSGADLPVMDPADYVQFAAGRIAGAIAEAWDGRAEGSIAFGLGQAVVGRNRRWVDIHGNSTMYGNTDTSEFSHIEGYEDHSVNVLATYDAAGALTGVIVNVPCPSQETEHIYEISADFWHETREQLRRRLGEDLFVLPQCSAAGDQSPHLIWGRREHERMLELKGRDSREEIGHRIADAVEEVLGCLGGTEDGSPVLEHRTIELSLPMRRLSEEDVREAEAAAEQWREKYEAERARLEADPAAREAPRWYTEVTKTFRRMHWHLGVRHRFEQQQNEPNLPVTLHVVRLGDVAIATNPFEYYLDFGIFIKVRSPAVQTFLVQLTGPGSYVPSARSVAGGGYGSVPASNPIGPEGGREVAEATIGALLEMWRADGD
ncbi:MAG: hypothetical protein ACOX9R_19210 [Armatimonadota bacterium]|jgi:hypothetical protein